MPVPGEVRDPAAVESQEVSITSGDATIGAYLARPKAPGTYGAVIVIHEGFGMNDHIRDLARRFANAGFIALAPDLYSRVGTPKEGDMQDLFGKMLAIKDSDMVRDLEASAALLRGQAGANGKVGCIGFCSGGRATLLFACSSDKVNAAVDCWGGFIRRASEDAETTPERPTPVLDLIANLHCPLLAAFGDEDQNPSPEDAREMESRAKAAGKDITVRIFENAGHAFLADYRPSYREKAAFELWPQVISFFETHLR
jgi:carboxymethylenebutenolidase